MTHDEMIKFFIWIVFFLIALAGMYFMLRKIGIVQ